MALEREMETYRRELPKLREHAGKFVLIHGDEVAGIWDTFADAVQVGDDRFGLEPFMVHEIVSEEHPRVVPWVSAAPATNT